MYILIAENMDFSGTGNNVSTAVMSKVFIYFPPLRKTSLTYFKGKFNPKSFFIKIPVLVFQESLLNDRHFFDTESKNKYI